MSDYYNYTYCIRCDNLERIEQALTRIFEQEDCHRISLPPLSVDIEELGRNPWLLCDELCTIGLFVGASGWTSVKMLPQELLCHRAIGAERPRLLELAIHKLVAMLFVWACTTAIRFSWKWMHGVASSFLARMT